MAPTWLELAGYAGSAVGGLTVFGAATTWVVGQRREQDTNRVALSTNISAVLDALETIEPQVQRIEHGEQTAEDYEFIRKTLNPPLRTLRIQMRGRRFRRIGASVARRTQMLALSFTVLGPVQGQWLKLYTDWFNTRLFVRAVLACLEVSDWESLDKRIKSTPDIRLPDWVRDNTVEPTTKTRRWLRLRAAGRDGKTPGQGR